MAEEDLKTQEGVVEEGVGEEGVEAGEPSQADPIEEKARASGWRPFEEWEGDPEEWRDAKTFVDRGELLSEIHKQKRTAKELREIVNELKDQVIGLTKTQQSNLEHALKAKRKEFIEEGNSSQVEKVDKMLEEVKRRAPQENSGPSETDKQRIQEVYSNFKSKNPWFEQDQELTQEANHLSQLEMARIAQEYQMRTGKQKQFFLPDEAEEIFDLVSKEIRKRNPSKFKNSKKDKAPTVESRSTNKGTSDKKKYTMKDIPEEYRPMVNKFVRQGVLSVHEYAESLKAQGVI